MKQSDHDRYVNPYLEKPIKDDHYPYKFYTLIAICFVINLCYFWVDPIQTVEIECKAETLAANYYFKNQYNRCFLAALFRIS